MSLVFATVALGTLGALIYKNNIEETPGVSIVSNMNNKKYKVVPGNDRQSAADTLATLEIKTNNFIKKASVMFPNDPHIQKLKSGWSGKISEIPMSDTIAYALGKEDVFICLRDERGKIQDIDDLFFVLLHELSHVSNSSYGHDDNFWKNFRRTLEIADKTGDLPYKNYDTFPTVVCGKSISSSPMTCVVEGTCRSEIHPLRPSNK
jgi:hypothetical protein